MKRLNGSLSEKEIHWNCEMTPHEFGWRVLDHPADVMIEVSGESFWDLCKNAASGLNHFLGEIVPGEPVRVEKLRIEGDTLEEQLVNFLRELLFRFVTTSTLVTKLNVSGHNQEGFVVETFFKHAEIGQNSLEVKGITYHGLSVKKNSRGYVASLVFDV